MTTTSINEEKVFGVIVMDNGNALFGKVTRDGNVIERLRVFDVHFDLGPKTGKNWSASEHEFYVKVAERAGALFLPMEKKGVFGGLFVAGVGNSANAAEYFVSGAYLPYQLQTKVVTAPFGRQTFNVGFAVDDVAWHSFCRNTVRSKVRLFAEQEQQVAEAARARATMTITQGDFSAYVETQRNFDGVRGASQNVATASSLLSHAGAAVHPLLSVDERARLAEAQRAVTKALGLLDDLVIAASGNGAKAVSEFFEKHPAVPVSQ